MMDEDLVFLLKSKKTIFTIHDLALIWNMNKPEYIKKKIYRYIKSGKIHSVRKGIYSKDEKYDKLELAGRIFTPSYISFETVLAKEGIIFQYYSQVFIASYLSRELIIDLQSYVFRKMKNPILNNTLGIEYRNDYYIASPERAFLDTIYLNKEYYFDNPNNLNWTRVEEILPIFGGNKRMEGIVQKLKNVQS